MALAFIRETTTDPRYSVWLLCNLETVELKDGPRDMPSEIYGSVLTPSTFTEADARSAFRLKKASDARLLALLDDIIAAADQEPR